MSVFFWAFCEDCGGHVEICHLCQKTATYRMSTYCKDCEEKVCCWHSIEHYEDENPSKKALYLCTTCTEARDQASAEVFSYWYWAADTTKPLSPTNVYRVPRFRKLGEGTTDPVERADEARAAYDEEMKFSGDEEEALKIYVSFYNRGTPTRNPKNEIREGFVSQKEILAGQKVTPEQFFAALQAAEEPDFGDSEPPLGNNPKTMSKRELRMALEEATLDLQHVLSRLRCREPTQQETDFLFAHQEWTGQLWAELSTR